MSRMLCNGMEGEDVRELQRDLNVHILTSPLTVDGIFGTKTDHRVREFQRERGLKEDGLVGPKTKALLKSKPVSLGYGGGPKAVVGDSRLIHLRPVFFRSAVTDLDLTGKRWQARLSEATFQWAKLGVQVRSAPPEVVIDAKLKNAGGNKGERDKLYALRTFVNQTAWVFVVNNDVADEGGAHNQKVKGLPQGKIVLSDRGASDTLLAHEVGHVLGLGHPSLAADVNTVMSNTGSNAIPNPKRNTIGNYSRLDWPTSGFEVRLNPDT